MPTREANINAFDLKVLKWLLNLFVTKTYYIDATTEQKKNLCKIDKESEEGVGISGDYIVKIWKREEEISYKLSTEKLNQLCAIFRKNYGWYDFYNAMSQFRPPGIPNGKPLTELKPEQYDLVITAAKKLFEDNKTFDEFAKNVLDKKEQIAEDAKATNALVENATETNVSTGTTKSLETTLKVEEKSNEPVAEDSLAGGAKDEDAGKQNLLAEVDAKKQAETTTKAKHNYFKDISSFIKRQKKILLPIVVAFSIAVIFSFFANHFYSSNQNNHIKVGRTDSLASKRKDKELKPNSTLDSLKNLNNGGEKVIPKQANSSNDSNNKDKTTYSNASQSLLGYNSIETHKGIPAIIAQKKVSSDSILKSAKYIKRAEIRVNNNDLKNAILYYDTAILFNPYSKETYILRAKVNEQKGNHMGAIADISKAILLDTGNVENYSTRASLKAAIRDFKGAINDFDKALEIDSNRAQNYISRGLAKDSMHDYESAIQDYTEAAQRNPKIILWAYSCRARSKTMMKDYNGAIFDWNNIIKMDSNNPDHYEERALVEFKINKISDGLDDQQKSLNVKHMHDTTWNINMDKQYGNPPPGREYKKKKGFSIFKSKKQQYPQPVQDK